MLRFPVYLDNAATAKVDPRVVGKMLPWLTDKFGYPASSSHVFGREARSAARIVRTPGVTSGAYR